MKQAHSRLAKTAAALTAVILSISGSIGLPAPAESKKSDSGEGLEVRVGKGSLWIRALLQVWYRQSDLDNDSFLVRRAEIKFTGKINKLVGYTAMFDASKQLFAERDFVIGEDEVVILQPKSDDQVLQDLYLAFFVPHHVIFIGQKKVPIGWEGTASSSVLDFPERAIVSGATFRGVRGYGDVRDDGLSVDGAWPKFNYTVGVYNGELANAMDSNDEKDLGVRFVGRPFQWLHTGAFHYDGSFGEEDFNRNRTGASLGVLFDDVFAKAEYMQGDTAGIDGEGWYVSTGYRFRRIVGTEFDLQAAVRYESFDQNTNTPNDEIVGPSACLSLFLDDVFSKVQLGYTHYEVEGPDEHIAYLTVQVTF